MRVVPIEAYIFMGGDIPQPHTLEKYKNKKGSKKELNSFEYYMNNCQPIRPQTTFVGDACGTENTIFPLTVIPEKDEKQLPGRLNILA
jgi:hypothetical protein